MEESHEHFVNHLAEVSKNNKVVLEQDIYNQRGVLVVKKGTEVDRELAQKIAKHKLQKPLDTSISLQVSLSPKRSLELFSQRLDTLNLANAVRKSDVFKEAAKTFTLLTKYPLVAQKLMVLAERLPDVFSRSIGGAVLAKALAKELKLPIDTQNNVFLACMISEVGLLHIDPKVVNKKGQRNADEIKLLQGHVVIAKHFTGLIPNFPSIIGRAVLEHHERADGFGYPYGRKISKLCIEGQILSMVDKLSLITQRLVQNGPYSWSSVESVFQIPSTAHTPEMQNAMIRLIKYLSLDYKPAFPETAYKNILARCIEKRKRLAYWFKEYSKIYEDHHLLLEDSEVIQPIALFEQLEYTVKTSGILVDQQEHWLKAMYKQTVNICESEIEEFYLDLEEIEEQCFFVMQKLVTYKEELVRLFGEEELPSQYYAGLMFILDPDEKRRII
ncbi:HD-GYP domain-containing protein [Paraglaciecola sp.]|uniref:HD-GYP domain-containing protein n=1 Tax=Paraglaciecola sp. TaxID=1920173 RepID=UPI003EF1E286